VAEAMALLVLADFFLDPPAKIMLPELQPEN
jgi:hypothetical protein